jgi:hypothetical protein
MPAILWPLPASTLALCLVAGLGVATWSADAGADKKTVCTITVNSADEKETFQRSLPPDKFQFIELVERGRPDWLASACSRQIRCDVLVISGHYDGGNEFFSEHVDAHEFLPVDEMERASCSSSCSTLFSQLKEVYLFGCNTLNPERQSNTAADIARNLVVAGHSPAEAESLARALSARYGDSSRDRMRQIFPSVPVIYGFSSVAPLGPTAAFKLNRYFHSGTGEIGSGRASSRLLANFAGHSIAVTAGLSAADPQVGYRRDFCQFSGDQLSAGQKVAFVHQILNRDMAEVRLFLDRVERYTASLRDEDRLDPSVEQALDEIARDERARSRYLTFARGTDPPAARARMLKLAHTLGWLTVTDLQAELIRTIGDSLARNNVGPADVDLACTLNRHHELDGQLDRLPLSPVQADRAGSAAVLACLGSVETHARVLRALTSSNDDDVHIAQVYLRHRPITDINELRALTAGVARMTDARAQARALDTLAGQGITDRQSLEDLTQLFAQAWSGNVQLAIAGILLRSDYQMIASADLLHVLRQYRRKASTSDDMIDVLIRRVQAGL